MDWKNKSNEQAQQLREVVPALQDFHRMLEGERDHLDRKINGLGSLIGRINGAVIEVPTVATEERALPVAESPPKKRGRKPKSEAAIISQVPDADSSGPSKRLSDKRLAIARILETDGPLMPGEISKRLGLPANSTAIYSFIKSDWFVKCDGGCDLSDVARQALDKITEAAIA